MKQPLAQLFMLKPPSLAYAISVGVLSSSIISTPAQASCVLTSNNLSCDQTGGTPAPPYVLNTPPSVNDLNANINGDWEYSGSAAHILSIQSFTGNSTININGNITWSDINLNSPPGTAGAINIGNSSAFTNTGFNLNTAINSKIELNLLNATYANQGATLYAITAVTSAGQGINFTNNGTVSIKNSSVSGTGLFFSKATSSDTLIKNKGDLIYTGLAQPSPSSAGLFVASVGNNTIEIINEKNISISTISTQNGAQGTNALTPISLNVTGAHKSINIINSGLISANNSGSAPVPSIAVMRLESNTNNIFNITNTSSGTIRGTNLSIRQPFSIYLSASGSINLDNAGNLIGAISTANGPNQNDVITNSGTMDLGSTYAGEVNGSLRPGIATFNGNDTLNNSGTIIGGINLGNGIDTLNLTAGSIQNIEMGSGNDIANWSGGKIDIFYGGSGGDQLTISNNADITNTQIISGGNILNTDDATQTDTLTFDNYSGDLIASKLNFWEVIEAKNNSHINIVGSTLNMSSPIGSELFARSGSSFIVHDGFTQTADLTVEAGGRYVIAPNSTTSAAISIIGNVMNAGLIDIAGSNAGSTLTIDGDYTGNNGSLKLRTVLAGDSSSTSRVAISGAASGSTQVSVTNLGGSGALTPNGIHLIETASSSSSAFSLLGNYVSAGAYDYALVQRTESSGDNWYLTSTYVAPPVTPPVTPPVIPPAPQLSTPLYTPNFGAMLANQRAANTLFTSRLEDRQGAVAYTQQPSLWQPWIRYNASKNEFDSLSQLHTKGHSNVMQLGTTVLSIGDQSRLDIGVMGGYADYNSRTKNTLTQRKASSDMHGYSVGPYVTWYASPDKNHGLYIDSWLLWNHFDNSISTTSGDKLKYKSKGLSASVEVGSDLPLATLAGNNWWLQPQAQLIYQGVKANDYRDAQNVDIKSSKANYQARLGLKTYLDINNDAGADYRPYVALNWLHNTEPYAVEVAGNDYGGRGMKNIGEVKLGLEGKLSANNQLWINTTYAHGGSKQKDYGIDLGWRYSF